MMADYAEKQKKRGHKADLHTIKRIVLAFSPYKVQVTLVLIAILLTTVLGLFNPFIIRYIFDDAIGKRDANLLVILVLVLFVIPVITAMIGAGQTYLNNTIGQRVMRDFRNK